MIEGINWLDKDLISWSHDLIHTKETIMNSKTLIQ